MEPFESIVYKTPPAEFAPKSSRFRPESDLPSGSSGKKRTKPGTSPAAGAGGKAVQLKKLGAVKPLAPPQLHPQQQLHQTQRPVLLPGHGQKVHAGARSMSPPPTVGLSNTWGGLANTAQFAANTIGGANTVTSPQLSYSLSPKGSPTAFPNPQLGDVRAYKSPQRLPGGVPSPRYGQAQGGYAGGGGADESDNLYLSNTVGSIADMNHTSGVYSEEDADGLLLADLTPPSQGVPNLKKLDLDQVVPDTDTMEPRTPRFTTPATVEIRQGVHRQVIENFAVNLDADTPGIDQALCYNVRAHTAEVFAEGGLPVIDCRGTLTFTPSYHFGGSSVVTVTLSDNAAVCTTGVKTSKPGSFKITVVPGNVVVKKPKDWRSQTTRQNMPVAILPDEDVGNVLARSVSPQQTSAAQGQLPSHSVFPPWNVHRLRDKPRIKGHQDRALRKIIGFTPLADIFGHRRATQPLPMYSATPICGITKQFVRGGARGGGPNSPQLQLADRPDGSGTTDAHALERTRARVDAILATPSDAAIAGDDIPVLCEYVRASAADATPNGVRRTQNAMGRVVMRLLQDAGFSFASSADDAGEATGLGAFDIAEVRVLVEASIEKKKVARSLSVVDPGAMNGGGSAGIVTEQQDRVAAGLLDFALLAQRQHDLKRARMAADLAVRLFTALHGGDHHYTVTANLVHAEICCYDHRIKDALEAVEHAREGSGLVHLPTDPESAVIGHLQTYCKRRCHMLSGDEALRQHQQAHSILLKHCRPTTDAKNNPVSAALINTLGESYMFLAHALHAKGAFSEAMAQVEAAVSLGAAAMIPWMWKFGTTICLLHSRYKEGPHSALVCVDKLNAAVDAWLDAAAAQAGGEPPLPDPALMLLRAVHPAVEVASGASSLTAGIEGLQNIERDMLAVTGDRHPLYLQARAAVGAALLKRCGTLTPKERRLKDKIQAEARALLYDIVEKESQMLYYGNPQVALTLELAAVVAEAEQNYPLAQQYLQTAKTGLQDGRLEEIGCVGSSGMLARVYEARVDVLCQAQLPPAPGMIQEYHDMAEGYRTAFGDWDARLVAPLLNLAEVSYAQGEYDYAHRHFAKALANVDSQNMHFLLGALFRPATQLTPIEVQERNRLAAERLTSAQCVSLAKVLSQIAMVYERQGLVKQAETSYMQTLASFEIAGQPHHIGVCTALDGLARLLYCQGHHGDALSYFDKAYTIRCNFHGALKDEIDISQRHMQIVEARVRQSGYNLVKHEVPGRFPVYF